MQDAQVNKILVVGAPQVGKKHMIHHLFKSQQPNNSAAVCFTSAAQDQTNIHTCTTPLRLQNKYYSTAVEFTCYKPLCSSAKDLAASTIIKELPLDQYHAIIILFSLYNVRLLRLLIRLQTVYLTMQSESYEIAKKFAEIAQELGNTFETALCIGNIHTHEQQPSNEASPQVARLNDQDIQTWCIDNSFEYIRMFTPQELAEQVIYENDDHHGKSTSGGLMQAEKFGFDRVLEALESTMWPHMTKSSSTRSAPQETVQESKTTAANDDKDDGIDGVELDEREAALVKQLTQFEKPAKPSENKDEYDEAKAEREMEQMEKIFTEIADIRKNGHMLNGDARKQRAAAMAMQLFKMLQLDEDGGDDELADDDDDDDFNLLAKELMKKK